MKAAPQSAAPARRGFEPNWPARLGWALLLLYVVYAGSRLGFTWERFAAGLEHGGAGSPPPVSPPILAPAAPLPPPPREAAEFRGCDPFLPSPFAPRPASPLAPPP